MKMRESDPTTSHINTFSQVLAEVSLQGLNVEEEIKALVLLLSPSASWEVFYMTILMKISDNGEKIYKKGVNWTSVNVFVHLHVRKSRYEM